MAEFRGETDKLIDQLANLLTDSPTERDDLLVIIKSLVNQEAVIKVDDKGRPIIHYKDDKEQKLLDSVSKENLLVNPNSTQDKQSSIEECLTAIDFFKKTKAPSGVVLDKSKIYTTTGEYRENVQFEKETNKLGSGNSGCIFPTKDIHTKAEHAQKTIKIQCFRSEEIEAWVDLSVKGLDHAFPELYMFQIDRNTVVIHMEKLDNALTLHDVKGRVNCIFETNAALLKPLCLSIFLNLLEIVHSMHEKGWTHGDLHDRNAVIQKKSGSLKVKVLDFGDACKTDCVEKKKSDVLNALRIFIDLYLGQEYDDPQDIESRWRVTVYTKMKEQSISEDERKKIAAFCQQAEMFHVDDLIRSVKEMIDEESDSDWMKDVLRILFKENDDETQNTDETRRDLISSGIVSIRM